MSLHAEVAAAAGRSRVQGHVGWCHHPWEWPSAFARATSRCNLFLPRSQSRFGRGVASTYGRMVACFVQSSEPYWPYCTWLVLIRCGSSSPKPSARNFPVRYPVTAAACCRNSCWHCVAALLHAKPSQAQTILHRQTSSEVQLESLLVNLRFVLLWVAHGACFIPTPPHTLRNVARPQNKTPNLKTLGPQGRGCGLRLSRFGLISSLRKAINDIPIVVFLATTVIL